MHETPSEKNEFGMKMLILSINAPTSLCEQRPSHIMRGNDSTQMTELAELPKHIPWIFFPQHQAYKIS